MIAIITPNQTKSIPNTFAAGTSRGKIINAISKNAFIEPTVKLGKGVFVGPGSILLHKAVVGDNCIIGEGVIAEFNTKIGENCNIDTGSIIGGNSSIERNVSVGIRATICRAIKVGKNQNIEPGLICKENLPSLKADCCEYSFTLSKIVLL